MRFAIVGDNNGRVSRETVEAYLPSNYVVLGHREGDHPWDTGWIIGGEDSAGWTMDGFVIPRLRSGMYGVREYALAAVEAGE